jgi:HK97 family phage major capsid protein
MPAPVLTPTATEADVRKALGDAAQELVEIRSKPADQRTDDVRVVAKELLDFVHEGDAIVRAFELARQTPAPDTRGSRGHQADLQPERRSIGHQVTDSDGYRQWLADGKRGAYIVEVRQPEVRNLIGGFTTGAFDSGADGWLPVGSPQLAVGSITRRRAFIRDIMNVVATGLKVVPYVREANQLTNETGAANTAEGSAKAEVVFDTETYNAVIEKITAWLPITDEIASDAPTLMGYINGRLEYMLMLREEQQVLAGSGTSPQIQGLKTLTGIQTQTAVAGDLPGTVAAALGKVENYDGEANGVVVNPIDFWTAVGKRHANQFDNANQGGGAPNSVDGLTWGYAAVRTRAVASAQGYVGAFGLGASLFVREDTTIKVADQHSDYFLRNLQVVRGEKRIGVAWHNPKWFVDVTMPTS